MNIVTHGLMGAALLAPFVKRLKLYWLLLTVAFVLGIAPDALPWFYYSVLGVDRWAFYSTFHEAAPWWLLMWPPYALHVGLDVITHTVQGAWFVGAYVLDVLFALTSLAIIWYFAYGQHR